MAFLEQTASARAGTFLWAQESRKVSPAEMSTGHPQDKAARLSHVHRDMRHGAHRAPLHTATGILF